MLVNFSSYGELNMGSVKDAKSVQFKPDSNIANNRIMCALLKI